MKVLHVAETVRGGIATYMRELDSLQEARFGRDNVHYVVPEDHIADLKGIDVSAITSFKRSGRNLNSLARLWITTEHVVRRFKPDVIHVHSTFAGVTTRLSPWLRFRPAKLVYCPHGWAFAREASAASGKVTAWIERLLQSRADSIVCISANERRLAIGAGLKPANLAVVISGISTTPTIINGPVDSWDDLRTKVLYVGRLDKQKGFDLLIQAAAQLQDEINVRMIGAEVIGSKVSFQLPSNVTTMGWRSSAEVEAQLAQADVLVVPSRWEAFGLVVLEGMRASKPVIAFDIGAFDELIETSVTGLLCKPVGVTPLVNALRCASTLDLPRMGDNGRARFLNHFTSTRMHEELEILYKRTSRRTAHALG